MSNRRGMGLVEVVWIVAGLPVIIAAGWHLMGHMRSSSVPFSTPFQAVLLTNGATYFGYLQGYGEHSPVLTTCITS